MTSFRPVEPEGVHEIGRRQPVSLMRSNNTNTVENPPVSHVNSGLSLALTVGGMSFFSSVMAPLVFGRLPFKMPTGLPPSLAIAGRLALGYPLSFVIIRPPAESGA